MAWTQADLDEIESKLAQGVKRVRLGQREREFHSIEQMKQVRLMIKNSLLEESTTNTRPRAYYSRTRKGL